MLGAIADKKLNNVIEFEVSDTTVLTIQNLVRNNKARYAKHDVQGKKPISEFIGPDLDTLTFDIELKAYNGVNPLKEMNKLIVMQRNGELVALVIGDMMMGMYRWTIQDLSNSINNIDNKGKFWSITVNVSLQEYV